MHYANPALAGLCANQITSMISLLDGYLHLC